MRRYRAEATNARCWSRVCVYAAGLVVVEVVLLLFFTAGKCASFFATVAVAAQQRKLVRPRYMEQASVCSFLEAARSHPPTSETLVSCVPAQREWLERKVSAGLVS